MCLNLNASGQYFLESVSRSFHPRIIALQIMPEENTPTAGKSAPLGLSEHILAQLVSLGGAQGRHSPADHTGAGLSHFAHKADPTLSIHIDLRPPGSARNTIIKQAAEVHGNSSPQLK